MKRISQRVWCPEKHADTRFWNDGTLGVSKRITFNNENGIHVHKILENQQSLSSVLDGAGEKVHDTPTRTELTLYVSPTKEYKTKEPLKIGIKIGENHITHGELALRAAELIKKIYYGIQNEFSSAPAPSFSDYPELGHPVPFERMLLASLDCMEEEDKRTWQAVYALD